MKLRLFPKHTGVWEGTYTRIAPDGTVMFTHTSQLQLKLVGSKWYQTNYYTFEDGREEFHNFGEAFFDESEVMIFDNPRILGKAWEDKENIILTWTYRDQPGSRLYEIISLISEGHRMRVWQFSQNDEFQGLMMIEEWQKAKQDTIPQSHFDQASYIKEATSVK